MFTRGLPVVLTAVAAVALVGCSSSTTEKAKGTDAGDSPVVSTPVEASAKRDACDLLTEDVAQQALGTPDVVFDDTSGGQDCTYSSGDGGTVMLNLADADTFDFSKGTDSQAVEGVGDEAFVGTMGSLWVRHGNDAFMVMVTVGLGDVMSGADSPAELDTEKTVAQQVLAKM